MKSTNTLLFIERSDYASNPPYWNRAANYTYAVTTALENICILFYACLNVSLYHAIQVEYVQFLLVAKIQLGMQRIYKLKTNYELENAASNIHLCLDLVLSAERVVNRRQIVSAFSDGF